MIIGTFISCATVALAFTASAQTDYEHRGPNDTGTTQNHDYEDLSKPISDQIFRANEFSIDAFGMGSLTHSQLEDHAHHFIRHDSRIGAGVGINYFFTRYLGIGGDAYTEDTQHSFVDSASANLILRIPIDCIHLAPYVFGGGGYQWDWSETWFEQAGVGLEFRFTKNFGIFTDGRYVWNNDTEDIAVGRLGFRFAF
jgi:hypothetical protein